MPIVIREGTLDVDLKTLVTFTNFSTIDFNYFTRISNTLIILRVLIIVFIQLNSWMLVPAFFLTFGLLMALHVKRKEHPINLILLAAFTVIMAYTVGVMVTFFDKFVVLQAFILTSAVVAGLTAFTFQTKRDFSSFGAALYSGLMILIGASFIHLFVGGEIAQTGMAVFGAILFCFFIVYDTQMIMSRVSEEEYILATIQLYLDIINLFMEILKILNKSNR